MMEAVNQNLALVGRTESFSYNYYNSSAAHDQNYSTMMEKRQLFLRSYQFHRKRSLGERIKSSFIRVKRVVWFRLRAIIRVRKLVFPRIRHGFYYRRRRFLQLINRCGWIKAFRNHIASGRKSLSSDDSLSDWIFYYYWNKY